MFLMWEARKLRAKYARDERRLREDIIRINAEKVHMAAERVEMIRHIDAMDRAAVDARQTFARMLGELRKAHDVLAVENAELRTQVAGE